jgi:hypothetical protein
MGGNFELAGRAAGGIELAESYPRRAICLPHTRGAVACAVGTVGLGVTKVGTAVYEDVKSGDTDQILGDVISSTE